MAETPEFSRRGIMTAAAISAAAGITANCAAQAKESGASALSSHPGFAPMNPIDNAYGYAKMEGALDGSTNYHLASGYILGFMPGELPRQLTGFQQLKINKIEDQGDGVYLDTYSSIYMFTPVDEDTLLHEWTNPYTGVKTEPFHYRSGPSKLLITPEGFKSPSRPDGSGRPNPFVLPWLVMDDTVFRRMNTFNWFPSDLLPEEWPLESPGEQMISSFLTTAQGSLKELSDRSLARMNVTSFTNAQTNWLPWMLMGKIPGFIGYHVVGKNYAALEQLPPATLNMVEQVNSDILNSPFDLPYTLQFREYKNHRSPKPT